MATNVTFDPINKIIQITKSPVLSAIEIDFKQDIYSDGKEDWLSDPILNKYNFPIRAVGGDQISSAQYLGSTFFLLYGWRIRPYESNHRFTLLGNIYTDPFGFSPFTQTLGTYNVMIESKTSNLIDMISTTGGSGITPSDISDIAAATDGLITYNHGSGSYSTVSLSAPYSSSLSLIKNYSFNSLNILKGKWEITTLNQLIMYDEDGSTPLYEFNLYDINGMPTTSSIAMRDPV